MSTMPTRVDRELFNAAKSAGELHSRSAAQQLAHWARIGRELEASPAVTHAEVSRVLAGEASYDELGDRAQSIVRVAWNERIAERIDGLDLAERLRAAGRSWPEADADGNVVMRDAGPSAAGA